MKKLSPTARLWQIRRCRRNARYRMRVRLRLKKAFNQKLKRELASAGRSRTIVVYTPEKMRVGNPALRGQLLDLLNIIQSALVDGHKVYIKFDKTNELFPGGTLMFVAQIEKMLQKYPGKISCNYPVHETVEQLFQHIGFLQRLGLGPRTIVTAENVRHWHYLTGICADLGPVKRLFSDYREQIAEDVGSGLYDSISEAVTNTINHAYPEWSSFSEDDEKHWWMFAQQLDGNLDVVVYDTGVGIPNSLRNKPELKDYLAHLTTARKRRDSYLIEMAIESPRTVTRLPYRGKGLPEMLEFAQQGGIGGFMVISNSGTYYYSAQKQVHRKEDLELPINGTLIHWRIPLV